MSSKQEAAALIQYNNGSDIALEPYGLQSSTVDQQCSDKLKDLYTQIVKKRLKQ